jgi:hypothetical protein
MCDFKECKASSTNMDSNYCAEHLAQMYQVEIKTSLLPNAGKGLFTSIARKRNVKLVPYAGERIKDETGNVEGSYVLEYKTNHFIDCGKQTNCCAGRFVNDARNSKQKNCRFVYDKIKDEVWLVSTRHIKSNEELYCDYGSYYWKALK